MLWGSKEQMLRKFAGRLATLVSATAFLAACGQDPISPILSPSYSVNGMELTQDSGPEVGLVKICLFGQGSSVGPFTGNFTMTATGGTVDLSETIGPVMGTTCSYIWAATGAGSVTVTATFTGPSNMFLARSAVFHTAGGEGNNADQSVGGGSAPLACEGTNPVSATRTAVVSSTIGAAIWFKVCPTDEPPPPPPPPGDCEGLTPGYWKNWDNHYTAAQFAALIDGTSMPTLSNSAATDILKGNNPALVRLRKFTLANELTLSLTANASFPNPSGGNLTGSCTVGTTTLTAALALAHDMLANPGNYTTLQILNLGTVLDNFANM